MTSLESETTAGSGSSSSTSQRSGTSISGELVVDTSNVPTRKRNRSITVSEKYSQLVAYEVAPVEF